MVRHLFKKAVQHRCIRKFHNHHLYISCRNRKFLLVGRNHKRAVCTGFILFNHIFQRAVFKPSEQVADFVICLHKLFGQTKRLSFFILVILVSLRQRAVCAFQFFLKRLYLLFVFCVLFFQQVNPAQQLVDIRLIRVFGVLRFYQVIHFPDSGSQLLVTLRKLLILFFECLFKNLFNFVASGRCIGFHPAYLSDNRIAFFKHTVTLPGHFCNDLFVFFQLLIRITQVVVQNLLRFQCLLHLQRYFAYGLFTFIGLLIIIIYQQPQQPVAFIR